MRRRPVDSVGGRPVRSARVTSNGRHDFFFSYARLGADSYLDQFYDDLQNELIVLGRDRNCGFRDTRDVDLGQPWERELCAALQHTPVLVSIYSPHFFTREYCGKEWQAFADRIARASDPAGAASALVPILWADPREYAIPDVAKIPQLTNDRVGDDYARAGLRYLVRTNAPAYPPALREIASTVLKGIRGALPPLDAPPAFDRLVNAFAPAATKPAPPASPPARGPRNVRFVVAAATRSEIAEVRATGDAYEDHALDWRPYPPSTIAIGPLLQQVASAENLLSQASGLDERLDKTIADTEKDNALLIVAADPWTLRLDAYRGRLAPYDDSNAPHRTALLLWNQDDPETRAGEQLLVDTIGQTFPRLEANEHPDFPARVTSERDLRERLRTALLRTQARIIRYRARKAGLGGAPMPTLSATREGGE